MPRSARFCQLQKIRDRAAPFKKAEDVEHRTNIVLLMPSLMPLMLLQQLYTLALL